MPSIDLRNNKILQDERRGMDKSVQKEIVWMSLDVLGLEVCWLQGSKAEGTILRIDDDGSPFEVRYRFSWRDSFEIKSASLWSRKGGVASNKMDLRYKIGWEVGDDKWIGFEECSDLDLWPTPLTNTFAIRRLGLKVGSTRDLKALWIGAPSMEVKMERQRYTRVAQYKYLFESLDSGFRAELKVDQDGIVEFYSGLFQRIGPRDRGSV